jgi:hypothetical protein
MGNLKMVTKKTTTKKPAVVAKVVARTKKEETVKKVVKKPAVKKAPTKTVPAKAVVKPRTKKTFSNPKEQATYNKEPWVGVLETHVNPDNPANGFFELDWNEYFIVQLKSHGYDGPTEESIVEAWFQMLCKNIGNEQGVDMEQRGSGYINVQKLDNNRSEVS